MLNPWTPSHKKPICDLSRAYFDAVDEVAKGPHLVAVILMLQNKGRKKRTYPPQRSRSWVRGWDLLALHFAFAFPLSLRPLLLIMAYNTFSAPGFVRVVPLPVRRVSPGTRLGGGLLATSKRVVPAAVAASPCRASAVARTLLAAAALSVLCVTPASAASLDNGQAVFEKSCAAYVV